MADVAWYVQDGRKIFEFVDYPPERFRFLRPRNDLEFEHLMRELIRSGHRVFPRDYSPPSGQLTLNFN